MSLSETRPPWLLPQAELESFLSQDLGTYTLQLSDLSKSRHGCQLVDTLLTTILRSLQSTPSPYEVSMARQHLAVELQRILLRWVEEGLRRTLEGSFLGASVSEPSLKRRRTEVEVEREPAAEKDFRCPYYIRDSRTHPECAEKRFPNPRKLKEHIWRFTRPFKCGTCGEGFGREKTRAIHCDQRKVPCVPSAAASAYEGSSEQVRDRKIERAKTTAEMVAIFEEFEGEGGGGGDESHSPWYPTPPPVSEVGVGVGVGRGNLPEIVVTPDDFGGAHTGYANVWNSQPAAFTRALSEGPYYEEIATPGYGSFPPSKMRMRFR